MGEDDSDKREILGEENNLVQDAPRRKKKKTKPAFAEKGGGIEGN